MTGIEAWSAKTVMWAYAGLMAALAAAYYAVPSHHVLLWGSIGWVSAIAVVIGIRRNKPRWRAPWMWIIAGILTFSAGDTTYNVIATTSGNPNPFPSWADFLYIVTYVLLALGLLGLARAGAASVDRTVALDVLIFTAAVGLLWWLFLIGPRLSNTSNSFLEQAISVAYPLGDVLLLTVAGRLFTVVRGSPAVALLIIGSAGTLVSDILYGYAQLHANWSIGGPIDLGWLVFYVSFGAAALTPSMADLTEPRVAAPREINGRHQLLYAVLLLIPLGVFIAEAGAHPAAVAVFLTITFLLILARLYSAINSYRRVQVRGQGLRDVNAMLLSATDAEGVADALRQAVEELLPPRTPFRVQLVVNNGGELFAGKPGPRARVADTRTLPDGLSEKLGDWELTLVCPLTVTGRPTGDPQIGAFLIATDEVWLGYLKMPMELVAAHAALAVERVDLTYSAFHDSLTGLANRGLFTERIGQVLARAEADGTVVGVLFLDLDDFKVVNDSYGHEYGDRLLLAVAGRLTASLRPGDIAARLGGDEFAALVVGPSSASVEAVASRVVSVLSEPFTIGDRVVSGSASIGVATSEDNPDGQELLRQADVALYVAKHAGKGQWRRYETELHTEMVDRLELRAALDRGITKGELAVEFQPIVGLRTGVTAGFEALVRWDHPVRGRLLPDQFIDLAEDTGLVVPMGRWVIARALAEAAHWPDLGGRAPYVAINVSGRQFRTPGFVTSVLYALDEAGLPPSRLMLEITESLLMPDDEQVWDDLVELRRAGVRVAIDDFGTGYSSLSYLRHVPLDALKIDRLFTATISTSAQQSALVEGIVRLAHTLGLEVIAEGIERPAERDMLARFGCRYGQGFLFSHPLSADAALEWMRTAGGSPSPRLRTTTRH
jgi:diguanylate cyclase (GGDEF)-like protein